MLLHGPSDAPQEFGEEGTEGRTRRYFSRHHCQVGHAIGARAEGGRTTRATARATTRAAARATTRAAAKGRRTCR